MNWREYRKAPTVAERKARAKREAAKLAKKRQGRKRGGKNAKKTGAKNSAKDTNSGPVEITGRNIATSFWGKAWCANLERYHDYHSRLARGRSYVRSGCVVALSITDGEIKARVSGTKLYTVTISVKPLGKRKWQHFRQAATDQISSVIDLLRGEIPTDTLEIAVDKDKGLFPAPREISLQCSCPDWAKMCKHVAAVLYGVGNRLDENPELFFILRGCNLEDLRSVDGLSRKLVDATKSRKGKVGSSSITGTSTTAPTLGNASEAKLGKLFGIDLESTR